jgi:hypothetical protein
LLLPWRLPGLALLLLLLLIPGLLLRRRVLLLAVLVLLPGVTLARHHMPTCLHLHLLLLLLGPPLGLLVLLVADGLSSSPQASCACPAGQQVGAEPADHGICMLPHGSHCSRHGHAHSMEILCCSGCHLAHLFGGMRRRVGIQHKGPAALC